MNKKNLSVAVILSTILSVIVMIIGSDMQIALNTKQGFMRAVKSISNINIAKNIKEKFEVKKESINKIEKKTNISEVKLNNPVNKSNETSNNNKQNLVINDNRKTALKEYKDGKLQSLYEELQSDIHNYYNNTHKDNVTANNTNKESEEKVNNEVNDATVFSTYSKPEEKIKSISSEDKLKILELCKKLSPIDSAKINEYLKTENSSSINNAIKLLKDRLSEKDFEPVKIIADKYK